MATATQGNILEVTMPPQSGIRNWADNTLKLQVEALPSAPRQTRHRRKVTITWEDIEEMKVDLDSDQWQVVLDLMDKAGVDISDLPMNGSELFQEGESV